MEESKRIDELVELLNRASESYYNDKDEIMSNFEWDSYFDELTALEEKTGYVRPDSPTQKTGSEEEIASGKREQHEYPALSLAKSKDVNVLKKWAGNRAIWLSWKLDGLTLVVTYDDGALTKIMTRGGGVYGTNITYMRGHIRGIPEKIKDKGHLVVRGEATISYTDFERINEFSEDDEKYSNPRNLVSGTLALDIPRLNEVDERGVSFNAFTLVHTDEEINSWGERMRYLEDNGFTCVDRELTDAQHLEETIEKWTKIVRENKFDIPVDGLVITYDDTEYASTGSVTGHHATNAGMAFKWQDTSADTVLDHIEWSCAASTISPVAVFEPVWLEGTTVKRASLCNISEMKRLGIGADKKTRLTIIKSNMIIPKCIQADNRGTTFEIPDKCPVCGAGTMVKVSEKTGTETLHCMNPKCQAKHAREYSRFVSKPGMDIDGLSIETLIKFMNMGFITDFADIYNIHEHKEAIIEMEGFGEKSYSNLIESIEKSRNVTPVKFIYALCIPMIGTDAAKKIVGELGTEGFFERLKNGEGFADIEGIGPEKSGSILNWYENTENKALLDKLLKEVKVEVMMPATKKEGSCMGLTFVITGDVHIYKNREEFKAFVESSGGKVAGSISGKTSFLVNNDFESTSGKNKKAKELGIPIITEDEFVSRFSR
ncbi:MAG: NAD-dependent DNA ligase LigA [Acetatifactor sp.]|nr:NAD-dependent DNA ligase LigA [Acetatifactor sp.]